MKVLSHCSGQGHRTETIASYFGLTETLAYLTDFAYKQNLCVNTRQLVDELCIVFVFSCSQKYVFNMVSSSSLMEPK